MDLHEGHITRFTIDGNTTLTPGSRGYNHGLVAHIERSGLGTERWRITSQEMVFNHRTGQWDADYTYRHADDRECYLTALDEAAHRIDAVIEQLREEYGRI